MPFQILSLSGGGFLGLYSITVLAELEREAGRPLVGCFDLMAGTSVGGIIVLGLAAGVPAADIKSAFEDNGARIFSDRRKPQMTIARWLDLRRTALSSKYDGRALRETIVDLVGEKRMGNLDHCVLIPAVNLSKGQPQAFKTPHHPNFVRDRRLGVADVAMATAAAPIYFPIAKIGDELFADGGLYANSPDLMALHEAEHFLGADANDVRLLSIGTTTSKFSFGPTDDPNLGAFDWVRDQRLVRALMGSQQMSVDFMVGHKLGDRYIRIDYEQSSAQERELALDIATDAAQGTIRGVAQGSAHNALGNPALREMLRHQAPAPAFNHQASDTITTSTE